ncbi:bifunctional alpha/beta hydrolase/OsmC family protein [Desulfuromonas sp. TF]|uniref:bifunctional alpha/beta hydrolase/OsmC family protein n=1 Tax=Desulfuromonas sp. TF TaxID=1232410 RepID=UPI000428D0C5|nr:bifunctional alpha/beta hydrolase/OsmC family protein [Desulfuromonas sp. TF]
MKQKKITFTNAEGTELVGLLDLPEDEKPVAYALFAHCFTCTKNLAAAANICRALSRRRIAVLRFDFTGIGESEGEFADTTFSTNISDLIEASRFLEKEYGAPRILIGHSLGGTAALMAADRISSVSAIATIAAPCHPRHIGRLLKDSREEIERSGKATVRLAGRDFTIRREFLEDLEKQDPVERIARLGAALMVMHSPRDRIVGIDNAADIYRAARHPKNFISLDPADHLLSRPADSRYAGHMIASWAERYLEAAEETEALPEMIDNRVTSRTGREGFRTDLFANGFALVSDEPESYGGSGQGPSPYDLLQAALGACTGMTVQMYARRKEWPLEEAVVRLRHEKIHADDCVHCEEKGRRIDRFERELELKGPLKEEQRRRLLEIAEKCPVHRTLNSEVLIETRLRREEED